MPIGALQTSEVSAESDIKLVTQVKTLGIYLSRDISKAADKNIKQIIPIIQREIGQWKRRKLTPVGKICVIKSLLLAKLVHLFMALPNPSTQVIKQIETMLFRFVWNDKNDRIKRSKLVQGYANEGLKMVDITSFIHSMKLAWLKRLLVSKADWTHFMRSEIPRVSNCLYTGSRNL